MYSTKGGPLGLTHRHWTIGRKHGFLHYCLLWMCLLSCQFPIAAGEIQSESDSGVVALGSFTSLDRAEKFKIEIQTELSKSAPRPAASVILRDFTTAGGRNIKRVLVVPSSETPDARSLVSYFKTHGYPDAWFLAGNFGNPVGTSKSTTRVATANPLRPTTEVRKKA